MSGLTHFDAVMTGLAGLTAVTGGLWVAAVKLTKTIHPLNELIGASAKLTKVAGMADDLKQVVEDHHGVPDRPGVPGRLGIMPAIAQVRADVSEVKKTTGRLEEGVVHAIQQNEEQKAELLKIKRGIPGAA